MEKGVTDLFTYMDGVFGLEEKNWRLYSPLTLAYIGDAIFDLVIRTILVKEQNCQVQKLHKRASALVKAPAQAAMADRLMEEFTPAEKEIYRRGHNAKPYTMAKNASRDEYLKATGLEAVLGYLYLNREHTRLVDLISRGMHR